MIVKRPNACGHIIQGTLSEADTCGTRKRCPLLRSVRYMATFLKESPYLGLEEVSACPLYRVSASQRFHCIIITLWIDGADIIS